MSELFVILFSLFDNQFASENIASLEFTKNAVSLDYNKLILRIKMHMMAQHITFNKAIKPIKK